MLLGYVAGGLGVLSFIWGFLGWYTEGSGDSETTYGGYAFTTQGTAIVAVSLIAGGVAAVAAFEKRKATLLPVVIAVAGLLLVVGQMIGKGSISVESGGNGPDTGVGIGLILELITLILQVGALVVAWLMATGKMPARRPQAPAQPQYPGYQQPQGYPQPQQGYGPPTSYPQQGAPSQDQPQYQPPQQPPQAPQQPQQAPQQPPPQYPLPQYPPPQQ
jgi:hypothetical protein